MDNKIVTIQIDKEVYDKMADFYAEQKQEIANKNVLFFAKSDDFSISIYKSLKVVFQGKKAEYESQIWTSTAPIKSTPSTPIINPNQKWLYQNSHAGSDEVGTGDYFGPISVVASYIDKKDIPLINELGVCDSKKLTDARIVEIAPKLLKFITYSQLCVSNTKFNEMTKKGFNMNMIKAYLHNRALLNLQKKLKFKIDKYVIDQFTPEVQYYKYLSGEKEVLKNIDFITKGESASPAVAVSSILARYSFLQHWKKMEEEIGMVLPKGANSHVDEIAKIILDKYGIEVLEKYCKISFKNTQKITNTTNLLL